MEIIQLTYGSLMPNHPKMVVGIGQFDGLHRAHLSIISKVKEIAKDKNIASGIITFDPHPDYVLGKRIENTYITPLEKKISILQEIGIDYMIIISFTLEVASMASDEFVFTYLNPINIDTIVAGFDYRYGYRGSGTVESLKKHTKDDVSVFVVDEILFHEAKMGATLIRELLSTGDVVTVKDVLGRYYAISGTVSPGGKVGRTLGFKTANIELSERYHELKSGVYGVIVTVKGHKFLGICNIGFNPTINTVARLRLEVHIIGFDDDIYGELISVEFVYRIRDELWFPKIDDLIARIHQDKAEAIIYMKDLI